DVRVPRENLVGPKNAGWQVAMTTLMFERSGGYDRTITRQIHELTEVARRLPRNGGVAWDDAMVRQEIAQLALEAEALRYNGYRQLTRQLKGLPPGAESSMMKLCGTDLALRIAVFAME